MISGLSIVIPAYNAQDWLEPTINKLFVAISKANLTSFEIIIVNDGSTDETLKLAYSIQTKHNEVSVLTHKNAGRFITRKRGVMSARYDRIFFIDTRVWINENSLLFLKEQTANYPDRQVWNGHINVAKKGNMIARFGDAITLIGWRRYFRKPRLISYGINEFDYYPKGTTMFSLPKKTLVDAIEWFEANTTDIKNSSDDTLLIRHIAEQNRIWLSPEFSATYFARTTLKGFISHSYYRGQYFVDGFLRPGTRFYFPLLMFLIGCVVAVVICVIWPVVIFLLIALAFIIWLIGYVVAIALGLSIKDATSLVMLAPLFALTYGTGIWRAVIRRFLK